MNKILVVKMGLSETLDNERGKTVSLGDVLRCTVILEPLKKTYPSSSIAWLVSNEAFPLLKDNSDIDRIMVWDEFMPFALMRERFDMVINLEKINGVSALADMMDAPEKLGFRFNPSTGEFDTYLRSFRAKEYIVEKNNNGKRTIWQEVILSMVGFEWKKQEYSLGYKPKTEEKYTVGLNWKVGTKWPTKGASESWWKKLGSALESKNIDYSWQQGMSNLYEYMDWINSCQVLITNDSLGLHLALALKKKIVALFGATDPSEVFMYGRGKIVIPKAEYNCFSCYSPVCDQKMNCMELMDIKDVINNVILFLD